MASITIKPDNISVDATDGELLVTVAARAGAALRTDCGAQGACRKCAVVLESGSVAGKDDEPVEHRPVEGGQEILTCQCVVDGDATLHIPPENRAADLAPFAKTLGRVAETLESSGARRPLAMRRCVVIPPPDKGDSVTDLDRVFDALRLQDPRLRPLSADLSTLQILPETLRKSNWRICANVVDGWCESRLIDVREAGDIGKPTFGLAIDIGTSTVAVTIISLETGRVVAAEGLRNGQIRHGDDVISRIIWSQENEDGLGTMRRDVVETLNKVIGKARESVGIAEDDIIAASVAGNSTMMNFLLGIPAGPIRRDPHTPPASWLPLFRADELGLDVWQGAPTMCLPTVSGFVGADISSGVLATGMADAEELSLLVDVGTNGELVVGMGGMLVCAACSAGPAFEGVGIDCGMHGAPGAIEGVAYDPSTDGVSIDVIGGETPLGVCGTGFIDTLATLFEGGVIDRGAHFVKDFESKRLRKGEFEYEFVIAFDGEHGATRDLAIQQSDIDNLVRSKAAVYAGISMLLKKLQFEESMISRLYLAGAFGTHIDIRKAVQIGLLPDLPPERVEYVGNTSLAGAHMCLVSRDARAKIRQIASAMTYVELSVEPGFMEEYVAAMFLPHTDTARFPSVVKDATD